MNSDPNWKETKAKMIRACWLEETEGTKAQDVTYDQWLEKLTWQEFQSKSCVLMGFEPPISQAISLKNTV